MYGYVYVHKVSIRPSVCSKGQINKLVGVGLDWGGAIKKKLKINKERKGKNRTGSPLLLQEKKKSDRMTIPGVFSKNNLLFPPLSPCLCVKLKYPHVVHIICTYNIHRGFWSLPGFM